MSTFLAIPHDQWLAQNSLAFAALDNKPETLGHALIVTRRPAPTWFDITQEERDAVMDLVNPLTAILDESYDPDGYNIGFNIGRAAGQTVPHFHLHVIPRYREDQVGGSGVRDVLPDAGP